MQKRAKDATKVLGDPRVEAKFPKAYSYAKTYWDFLSGKGDAISAIYDSISNLVVGKGISRVLFGVGRTQGAAFHRDMRAWFTAHVLLNPKFMGVQLAQQPIMAFPYGAYLYEKGNVSPHIMFLAEGLGQRDALFAETRSLFAKEAMAWAKESRRLEPHLYDDIQSFASKGIVKATTELGQTVGTPLSLADKYTRGTAFMVFAHGLEMQRAFEGGKMPRRDLFEAAMNMADTMMVDYRTPEKPLVFQRFGELGRSAGTFMTFPANIFSHLGAFNKQSRLSLMTLLSMQWIAGGLLGYYFRDEADQIIEVINGATAKQGQYWMPRIPTTREILLNMTTGGSGKAEYDPKNIAQWVAYGPLSMATNTDQTLSLGMSDPIPDSTASATMKAGVWGGKILLDTANALLNWGDQEAAMKALHSATPSGLKVIPEWMNKDSQGWIDPQTGKEGPQRGTAEWIARSLSTRTITEAEQRSLTKIMKSRKVFFDTMSESLLGKFERTGDPEYAQQWAEFTGRSVMDAAQALVKYKEEQRKLPEVRLGGVPLSSPSAIRFNFMQGSR